MRSTAAFIPVVAALLAGSPAHAAGSRWQLALESPIGHRASVATFADLKHGITAGYSGATYVTQDGGTSWAPAQNSSACRFGVEVVPGAAFTSGNMGHVRTSTDGGQRWTAAASFGHGLPRHARHLSFADARRGLIAGPDDLGLTLDAGATWTALALPGGAGVIAAVSASEEAGALRLRVLDESGAIFSSADAGKTWTAARSPLAAPVLESMTTPWAALRFAGAEGVLIAFLDQEDGARAHAYRTRDGGQTWTEESLPGTFPAGTPNLSHDGKLLTVFDGRVARVYRVD